MAVTSTTFRASLLIEYAEDGSILSRVQTNKTLVRDGTALLAPPKLEAVALDEQALAAAVGSTAAATSAQVTDLQAQVASLATVTSARDAALAQVDAMQTQVADLQTQLAAANLQLQTNATTPQPATGLKAYAAQKRYAIETGGLTVNGVKMPTDRDTQSMLMGGFLLAQVDPATVFKWKLADGKFATLSAQQVQAIAAAIGKFVEEAFKHEADAIEAIDAGTATTPNDVDAFFA